VGNWFVANFKVDKMKSQPVDHVLYNNSVSLSSIASLIQGYMLNCHCEGKSQATIKNYQYRLNCFTWFCQANKPGYSPFTNHPNNLLSPFIDCMSVISCLRHH